MLKSVSRIFLVISGLVIVWGAIFGLDAVLDSNSITYHELTEEIDQRDIDTGNALNYLGDDTSMDAVYEATQTLEHPPGGKF